MNVMVAVCRAVFMSMCGVTLLEVIGRLHVCEGDIEGEYQRTASLRFKKIGRLTVQIGERKDDDDGDDSCFRDR